MVYDLINKTLNLATDDFYNSWKEDSDLVQRMDFVEKHLTTEDPYECLAAFSFMEGVVLYSSFAFLKSFNMGGFDMIPHIASGVDVSCKEENSHFEFSSWTYRQLLVEEEQLGLIGEESKAKYREMCHEIAEVCYDHEKIIIDKIFEGGEIRTVKKEELLHFVRNRIDVVLKALNCEPMFNEESGIISEWFYDAISTYKYADFFSNSAIQYVRTWNRNDLQFDPDPDAPAENVMKHLEPPK